jgi:putative ABC transport system ATP-binding protein
LTMAILEFACVSKSFTSGSSRVNVLKAMDLAVHAGEFLMLTGPSGSGKTTFLHLAALLDRPDAGSIRLLGNDMTQCSESRLCTHRAEHLGIVFQRYALLPGRTALENVLFRFRYTRDSLADARRKAKHALERVHLGALANRPVRVLSWGEMQRVAIARAIATCPPLLVADEPTGNLDAESATRIMELFRELHASGMAIVMVTHNLTLLEYGSRGLTMRDGKLVPH